MPARLVWKAVRPVRKAVRVVRMPVRAVQKGVRTFQEGVRVFNLTGRACQEGARDVRVSVAGSVFGDARQK